MRTRDFLDPSDHSERPLDVAKREPCVVVPSRGRFAVTPPAEVLQEPRKIIFPQIALFMPFFVRDKCKHPAEKGGKVKAFFPQPP